MPRINGFCDKMGNLNDVDGLAVPDNSALEDQPMNGLSQITQLGDSSMGTTASIHEIVSKTLTRFGLSAPAIVSQTVLMKSGYFVGHKLRYDGGYAIYSAGGSTIEFYDEQGELLTTVPLEAATGVAA